MARKQPAPAEPVAGQWPADAVQRRSVADLVPYARNARTHSPEQVKQIAESITRFGFTVPVLVDEAGGIIAGHGRVLAAQLLGLVEVPVVVAAGWDDAKKRAYVLVDNKLALNSGWDVDLLHTELEALQAVDFKLGDLGFTADEFAALTAPPEAELNAGGGSARTGLGQTIIQFNIVFENEQQQASWFAFVRHLKGAYPDDASLGARLARFIADQKLAAG